MIGWDETGWSCESAAVSSCRIKTDLQTWCQFDKQRDALQSEVHKLSHRQTHTGLVSVYSKSVSVNLSSSALWLKYLNTNIWREANTGVTFSLSFVRKTSCSCSAKTSITNYNDQKYRLITSFQYMSDL